MLKQTVREILANKTVRADATAVNFRYINPDGKSAHAEPFTGTCCGAILRNGQGHAGIILRPIRGTLSMPQLIKWINNCIKNKGFTLDKKPLKANDVIKNGIKYFWDKIGKRDFYIALCLMRYPATAQKMVEDINKLVDDGVDFWQAFYICHGLRMSSYHYSFLDLLNMGHNPYYPDENNAYTRKRLCIDSCANFIKKMKNRKQTKTIYSAMRRAENLNWYGQVRNNTPAMGKILVDDMSKMFCPYISKYAMAKSPTTKETCLKRINAFEA